MKPKLRGLIAAFSILCLLLPALLIPSAAASADPPSVLEKQATEDSVYLYLKYSGQGEGTQIQTGSGETTEAEFTPASEVPVITWMLLDNSLSMPETDRAKAKELFTNLVNTGSPNERFILCTYDTHLKIVQDETDSKEDLLSAIEGLTHSEHMSYLMDVLSELLDREETRRKPAFIRIVVVSDAIDYNPNGLTREQLNQRLAQRNIPIYTLGVKRDGNDHLLPDFTSLAPLTGGLTWTLSDISDTVEVAHTLKGELPVRVTGPIPEGTYTGSALDVRVSFADGASVATQVTISASQTPLIPDTSDDTSGDTDSSGDTSGDSSGDASGDASGDISGDTSVDSSEDSSADTSSDTSSDSSEDTSSDSSSDSSSDTSGDSSKDSSEEEKKGISPVVFIVIGAVLIVAIIIVAVVLLVMRNRRIKLEKEGMRKSQEELERRQAMGQHDGFTTAFGAGNGPGMGGPVTLLLTERSDSGWAQRVPLMGPANVGRGPNNEIVVDLGASISSTHCRIFMENGRIYVSDLGSRNGTYVDGIRVGERAELRNGSILRLGAVEIRVEFQ